MIILGWQISFWILLIQQKIYLCNCHLADLHFKRCGPLILLCIIKVLFCFVVWFNTGRLNPLFFVLFSVRSSYPLSILSLWLRWKGCTCALIFCHELASDWHFVSAAGHHCKMYLTETLWHMVWIEKGGTCLYSDTTIKQNLPKRTQNLTAQKHQKYTDTASFCALPHIYTVIMQTLPMGPKKWLYCKWQRPNVIAEGCC